jgi:hypothetical protein
MRAHARGMTTVCEVILVPTTAPVVMGPRSCAQSRTRRDDREGRQAYPSNTASAPLTASALSITVRSSATACTEMLSAKNLASVT